MNPVADGGSASRPLYITDSLKYNHPEITECILINKSHWDKSVKN